MRGRAEALASAGRDAEIRGRQRLEEAAGVLVAAPEAARTVNRALAGPVSRDLEAEALEQLARRVLESPEFERFVREAAGSRLARELLEDAVRSAELQHAVEEILAGPAVRNALRRETRTYWEEVSASVRRAARRLDDAVEGAARRALARPRRAAATQAAGLASRGAAFAVDLAITHVAVLAAGALLGVFGSLLGLSAPQWLVGAFAGAGWTLLVGGYVVLFWTTVGQTPGMRALGLRVARLDGRPLGLGRALIRFAGSLVAIAPLFLGFVPVLFDERRRALQDFLAGSVVVRDGGAPVQLSDRAAPSARRSPAPGRG